MDITHHYLTIFTMEGFLKIYDLSESQAKLLTRVKNLYDMVEDFGEIIQAKTNSKGNKVAMTLAAANLVPDGKLYIWDIERDDLIFYDFRKYEDFEKSTMDKYFETEGEKDAKKEDNDSSTDFDEVCKNRIPLSLHWCEDDSRLLVCNAKKIKVPGTKKNQSTRKRGESKTLKDEDQVIVTMFVLPENGIQIHDLKSVEPDTRLLGVSIPYIVTLQKLSIVRDVMSDFNGLEECDKNTKEAVIDFSYNLSLGNMDAAFKSIKLVQSQGVWASLARMCVKTRRLDVASVCLGHMGDAKAARALRLAINDNTLPQEAKVAVLAIHLGLLDEAEQLYSKCGRYDLLNKLLRCRNKMEDAHTLAKTKDRINLRNTEYCWAKSLEKAGDFKEAAMR
ncbi:intraflagellar transport protein 140 homolog [Sitophilus oryzae]|uniref:Intraflagellar transport protein 140 homolog n=1 Tax=Sitophilus oryzae TaxID=7048 RepID=A0A6J2XGE3_SITOR|nr:intraflagellar transport protein 140 homolog [Sitophilus oryzae]